MARIERMHYDLGETRRSVDAPAGSAKTLGAGMKRTAILCALVIAGMFAVLELKDSAGAQEIANNPLPTPPGQVVFGRHCASCHDNPSMNDRAPDRRSLMKLTPEKIYAAVTTGSMAVPAKDLTDEQKRAVAEYLGGRLLDLTDTGSAENMTNRCDKCNI